MGVPQGLLFSPIPAEGPYFLDNHGRLFEVDRKTFRFLQFGLRSTLVTGPFGAICHLALTRRRRYLK
jgi:hypothetical protein